MHQNRSQNILFMLLLNINKTQTRPWKLYAQRKNYLTCKKTMKLKFLKMNEDDTMKIFTILFPKNIEIFKNSFQCIEACKAIFSFVKI